jgi:hypothetical protein
MAAKVIEAIIVFRVLGRRRRKTPKRKNNNFAPTKSRQTGKCRPITLMMASQGTIKQPYHGTPRGYFTEDLNYANA